MQDDVSEKTKVRRLRELMDEYYEILPRVHEKYLDQVELVLVESVSLCSSWETESNVYCAVLPSFWWWNWYPGLHRKPDCRAEAAIHF